MPHVLGYMGVNAQNIYSYIMGSEYTPFPSTIVTTLKCIVFKVASLKRKTFRPPNTTLVLSHFLGKPLISALTRQ